MGEKGDHKDVQALTRRRKRYERSVCSAAWAEALAYGRETLPEGLVICTRCECKFPAYYICNTGRCEDCKYATMPKWMLSQLPSSSSIIRGF